MSEPKLRYYLHSKVASTGHRPIYLSVGVGETRPVRQATGYTAHLAYFAPSAPHLVYGTQGRAYKDQPGFIWPIADPAHVNKRRKKACFDLSVEDNAKRLGMTYKVLTLEDIRKLPGYQPEAR